MLTSGFWNGFLSAYGFENENLYLKICRLGYEDAQLGLGSLHHIRARPRARPRARQSHAGQQDKGQIWLKVTSGNWPSWTLTGGPLIEEGGGEGTGMRENKREIPRSYSTATTKGAHHIPQPPFTTFSTFFHPFFFLSPESFNFQDDALWFSSNHRNHLWAYRDLRIYDYTRRNLTHFLKSQTEINVSFLNGIIY